MSSSPSYGYTYLTSYGWTGTGTGLRKGAIAKPLVVPPKKNLNGLGKDRDEAFPFWDHLFTAASKAITIKVASDDEDVVESTKDPLAPLTRTRTGILSNRRPISGTPASTSGTTTPHPRTDADQDVPRSLSLLATAKREAAKRGLYARFFRGPVLGLDDDACEDKVSVACDMSSVVTPAPEHVGDLEDIGETKKGEKRKSEETKEERRERKILKRERRAARAAKKAAKGLAGDRAKEKKERKDRKHQNEKSEAIHIRKETRKRRQKVVTGDGRQYTSSHRPSSDIDATDALQVVLTTKKKRGKRKDIPS